MSWLGLLVAGVVVGMVAASHRSFRIDECVVAWLAGLPDPGALWKAVVDDRTSDLQMPFYTAFIWVWKQIFPHGEWALRLSNVPWFALGLAALCQMMDKRLRPAVGVMLLASPFIWFLLDDARSYTMQLGLTMFVGACLVRLSSTAPVAASGERAWVWALCVSTLLLFGSSMMAAIWGSALVGAWLLARPWTQTMELLKRYWAIWIMFFLSVFALGLYYLWTLKLGARGYSAGPPRLMVIPFIFYELCGFSGLGPSRHVLRAEEGKAVLSYLPLLGVYGGLLLLTMVAGLKRLREMFSPRTLLSIFFCFLAATVVIFLAGVATHFRVQGRHFVPLLAPLGVLLGAGVAALWTARLPWFKACAAGFVLLTIISCLNLRFAPRHGKEDYRTAASIGAAALAKGEKVWWSAEPRGGLVYGLPVTPDVRPGTALAVLNESPGFLQSKPAPDVVIASKGDLYDNAGALAAYLLEHHYKQVQVLIAFTVWRKEGGPNPKTEIRNPK